MPPAPLAASATAELSAAVTAALERTRAARAALGADDALGRQMDTFIDTVIERLHRGGGKPRMPDRHLYLNKLSATWRVRRAPPPSPRWTRSSPRAGKR